MIGECWGCIEPGISPAIASYRHESHPAFCYAGVIFRVVAHFRGCLLQASHHAP